ncbi:MAG TPA: hypothetical protein VMC07_01290, partial [Candidatus Omnitrophota bacterium]|nr:hypothetical protein [Candidatus Omnitrophota bacterium]
MYKKYIERDGKKYGPYVYHSRKINGKVISEYHGKSGKKNHLKHIIISLSIFAIFLFVFLILENSNYIERIEKTIGNSFNSITGLSVEENLTNETNSGNTSNESAITNDNSSYSNDALINKTSSSDNESANATNESGIIIFGNESNVTVVVNETNETQILNQTNETSLLNETNITIAENTTLENATISTEQVTQQIRLGEPVKWKKVISANDTGNITVALPDNSGNITVTKVLDNNQQDITQSASITGGAIGTNGKSFILDFFSKIIGALTGKVIDESDNATSSEKNVSINVDDANADYEIAYETPAPYSIETDKSNWKEVEIVGPDSVHYENVLAFTNLSESLGITNPQEIKIYWVENNTYIEPASVQDLDGNGIYDYVEWNVPHLSNETFDIIVVTKAEHLDSNRNFISDIYDSIKSQDGIWSETIPDGDYVRIKFEKPLTSDKDITFYPKIISGNPVIEVYEVNQTEKIADYSVVSDEKNKILLTDLQDSQDTFDLKVTGGSIQIDYIVDPTASAFIDGSATSISGGTTLATLSTTFPAGTNVIIAAVQINTTNAATKAVNATLLKLNKAAGSTLSSNEFDLNLNNSNSYVLLGLDTSGSASQAYNVTAGGNNTNIWGEAKIIAIPGITSSNFSDSPSTATSTTGAEIGNLMTNFSAGNNIILAAIHVKNGAALQNITSGS